MIETNVFGYSGTPHFGETLQGTSRRFGAPRVPDIRACRSALQQGHHSEPGDCGDLRCWPCWPTGRISFDLVVQLCSTYKKCKYGKSILEYKKVEKRNRRRFWGKQIIFSSNKKDKGSGLDRSLATMNVKICKDEYKSKQVGWMLVWGG